MVSPAVNVNNRWLNRFLYVKDVSRCVLDVLDVLDMRWQIDIGSFRG